MKIISAICMLCTIGFNAIAQSPNSTQDLAGKINQIISECKVEFSKDPLISQLDEYKVPGLIFGETKWMQRDLTKLVDQDKKPSQEEKDAIFLARSITKECGQKANSVMKTILPTQFGTRNDANIYYSETYWMGLLNDQLTYGQLTKMRLEVVAEIKESDKEMNRLWKTGAKDSQAEMNQHVEKAEMRFMAALEKHQQMIAKRKEMGFTNCKKLGAFEYCSANK